MSVARSVLVVTRSADLVAKFRGALNAVGMADVRVDQAPSAALALRILKSNSREIDAVVADLAEKQEALAVLDELRQRDHPPAAFCALMSPAAELAAKDLSARIVCGVLAKAEDLPRALGARVDSTPPARLVLFAPAQEGAGASTTALHAAAALHRTHGLRTLFTELDYHSDAIAYRLRFPIVKSLAELDPGENWRAALTDWRGLHVLPAPQARALRRRGLPNLVEVLEDTGFDYDIVIGDLPCNTAAASADVLSLADRIYVVATAEVTSLYLARRRIAEVCTVGGRREAIRLIINRDRPGAVDSEMARQVTGWAPSCRLPNDYATASEAETEACTVSPASALGHAYEGLAADILGKPAPLFQAPTRSWGRLLAAWR